MIQSATARISRMFRLEVFACTLFCGASSLCAADLELRYGALERIIGEQMFTQDGRRYVRGSASAKCQYAYLEHPRLSANDARLRVTAKFSGRSALDVLGRCVGLGDSFDLTITATPVARNGAIGFQDANVSTVKDSYYIRRVRQALTQSFTKDFKVEVRDQARRLLESSSQPGAIYQQELSSFELNAVRVAHDALVLEVEFKLVVK
jgi:hypothetical protein